MRRGHSDMERATYAGSNIREHADMHSMRLVKQACALKHCLGYHKV